MAEKQRVNFELDGDKANKLKFLALTKDTTLTAIMLELIDNYLAENAELTAVFDSVKKKANQG